MVSSGAQNVSRFLSLSSLKKSTTISEMSMMMQMMVLMRMIRSLVYKRTSQKCTESMLVFQLRASFLKHSQHELSTMVGPLADHLWLSGELSNGASSHPSPSAKHALTCLGGKQWPLWITSNAKGLFDSCPLYFCLFVLLVLICLMEAFIQSDIQQKSSWSNWVKGPDKGETLSTMGL